MNPIKIESQFPTPEKEAMDIFERFKIAYSDMPYFEMTYSYAKIGALTCAGLMLESCSADMNQFYKDVIEILKSEY